LINVLKLKKGERKWGGGRGLAGALVILFNESPCGKSENGRLARFEKRTDIRWNTSDINYLIIRCKESDSF
jgi:hypothetical protein